MGLGHAARLKAATRVDLAWFPTRGFLSCFLLEFLVKLFRIRVVASVYLGLRFFFFVLGLLVKVLRYVCYRLPLLLFVYLYCISSLPFFKVLRAKRGMGRKLIVPV